MTEDLRYPTGKFRMPEDVSSEDLEEWKDIIAGFPEVLESTVDGLTEEQLSRTYRTDSWNVAQLIHHLADSHMNSFIRYKLALTEDSPVIKAYFEALWSAMPDGRDPDISSSLLIIKGVHQRWTVLMDNMQKDDWAKTFTHPEHGRKLRLDQNLALYAWHCNHHLAHIRIALEGE